MDNLWCECGDRECRNPFLLHYPRYSLRAWSTTKEALGAENEEKPLLWIQKTGAGLGRGLVRAYRATASIFLAGGLRTTSDTTPSQSDSEEEDGDVTKVMQWLAEKV